MITAHLIRPKKDTPLFSRGQKCYVKFVDQSSTACVVGRYRGKGRYVTGWLRDREDCAVWRMRKEEVNDEFAKRVLAKGA